MTKLLHLFPSAALILTSFVMPLRAQEIRINEVMSSNHGCFYDEDHSTPDWIELYNSGNKAVNLEGYGISDDLGDFYKWIFPKVVLGPKEYIVLAASGKDRKILPLYWETVINASDVFRYVIPEEDPGPWQMPEYDDSFWTTGPTGLGYGDRDDSTLVSSGIISLLARRIFTVDDPAGVKKMMLHLDYDDGFVAYLNGHEIARAQIGTPGVPPSWDMPALNSNHEARIYQGGLPDAFVCDSSIKYLVQGENVFAIEVHNADRESEDLSCIPFLSLGRSEKPANTRGVPSLLNLPDSYLHLNFKVGSTGELLLLDAPQHRVIDIVHIGVIPDNVSLGFRVDDFSEHWLFDEPTPGTANTSPAFPVSSATDPVFSQPGGFQTQPFSLEISGAETGDTIWYTSDGSAPKVGSTRYTGPVPVQESMVMRAIISGPQRMKRKPVTASYLMRQEIPSLATISLSTEPANFFDWDTGIYVLGPHAEPEDPHFGANFWEDWERPVHIELYETDGSLALKSDAGVKIYGSWSRATPQKSLAFFARNTYGSKKFGSKLFPDLPYNEYNNFLLRNSGNDWSNTMFRDALMTSLLYQTDLDRPAYRPVSVYLNGTYWGLLNMREKINEHYLVNHHGIDPSQVDMLEGNGVPFTGDPEHYNDMLNFLISNNPAIEANYNKIKTLMDVGNFMDYEIAEIFFDNTDWPGNNLKFWRPKTTEGKWRWFVFDTDVGFGLYDAYAYEHNSLEFALAADGPEYPNPPWSTFIIRRLLENEEFRNGFINRFADRLNTAFSYQTVLQHIDQMSNAIAGEIPYQLERWSLWDGDVENWRNEVDRLRIFALNRVSFMRKFIGQHFSNVDTASLKVIISQAQAGHIKLNTLALNSFPWKGVYFETIPVQLTAMPTPGHKFVRWEGPVKEPLSLSTSIDLNGYSTVKAVFEEDGSGFSDIVINEVYFANAADFSPDDWVELYNRSESISDLSGWILTDQDNTHQFVIPSGTLLDPGDYLVLSKNTANFSQAYPDAGQPIGDFSFGLKSTGDCVMLYSQNQTLVDEVCYGVNSPWPAEPKNGGASLELIEPDFDNSKAINWRSSVIAHGTPGVANTYVATGVSDDLQASSTHEPLLCFPNPLLSFTRFRFELSSQEWIRLSVFDLQGHLINILFEGETGPGIHELVWDGYDSGGSKPGPGVYLGLLETRQERSHCRIMIVR